MAGVRVEYVRMMDLAGQPVIAAVQGAVAEFAVTGSPTVANDRPTVPAEVGAGGRPLARVTALGAPLVVAWGADPTAGAGINGGLRVEAGQTVLISAKPGDRLSFVAAAATP